MDVPCRKPHFGVRIALAVAVGITFLVTIIFVAGSAGADPNEWLGKWMDVPNEEFGRAVCTKSPPCTDTTSSCPHKGACTWKSFEDKCWLALDGRSGNNGGIPQGPVGAQASCVRARGTLAEIDNAAQDKYAYDLCDKNSKYCFFGLTGFGDSSKLANWKWIGGSTSTYRNWWSTDEHHEPTGDGETAVSWMTVVHKDEIVAGAWIGFIIVLFYLILVCTCCSTNSLLVWCGTTKKNKCCLISSASLDGVMCAVLFLFAFGAVMRGDIGGTLTNIVLGALFLTGSIMGCMQCGPVGLMEGGGVPPPPVVGQVVGQPVGVAVGVEVTETNKCTEPMPAT